VIGCVLIRTSASCNTNPPAVRTRNDRAAVDGGHHQRAVWRRGLRPRQRERLDVIPVAGGGRRGPGWAAFAARPV